MDRRWLLAGLLIGAGGGTYAMVRAQAFRPRITDDTRLLLIGDSLAVGMNPHFKELATVSRVPYVSLALEGTRIDQWDQSQQLLLIVEQFQPTLVLVSLGTNDAYSALAPEAQLKAMEDLLSKLEATGSDVIWIGAPALPATYYGRHPNEAMLDAIRRAAPYYFASHELDIPRGPDELHPTSGGYSGWVGAIWEWLT